jgi:hypothetical protein
LLKAATSAASASGGIAALRLDGLGGAARRTCSNISGVEPAKGCRPTMTVYIMTPSA